MASARTQLDRLLQIDALSSALFGILALGAPHGLLLQFQVGYSHPVHETLRLYGCLRLACGWILWHVRRVDDGFFRRHVCEALFTCYTLQMVAILRAQFTDRHTWLNWFAVLFMGSLAAAYGSFRFGKGGNLIKVYELPSAGVLE